MLLLSYAACSEIVPDKYHLNPASAHTLSAQAIDPYSDMKLFGNHNKDCLKVIIHSTNQQLALRKHDHLQDLGISLLIEYLNTYLFSSALQ